MVVVKIRQGPPRMTEIWLGRRKWGKIVKQLGTTPERPKFPSSPRYLKKSLDRNTTGPSA
jgi:hypothetical protein